MNNIKALNKACYPQTFEEFRHRLRLYFGAETIILSEEIRQFTVENGIIEGLLKK